MAASASCSESARAMQMPHIRELSVCSWCYLDSARVGTMRGCGHVGHTDIHVKSMVGSHVTQIDGEAETTESFPFSLGAACFPSQAGVRLWVCRCGCARMHMGRQLHALW